jgi:malate synthase
VRGNIDLVLRFLCDETSAARIDAEFSRAQLWQWLHHETGVLDSGRIISSAVFENWLRDEENRLLQGEDERLKVDPERLTEAAILLMELTTASELAPNLPARGYRLLH